SDDALFQPALARARRGAGGGPAARRPRGSGVGAGPVADAAARADPLFLLPSRYEDRTRITPIGALLSGARAVVEGEVQMADVVFRRRRSLLVRISDGSGFLTLRFFHFSRAQQEGFARGT